MSPRSLGIIEIVMSGVCFGFLGIFGKSLFEAGVLPGELLALRFSVAALLSFFIIAIRRPELFRLPLPKILACAGLGVFGYALFSFCFFSALRGLSASLTVLLLYTYPVLVAVGAYLFFGETIDRSKMLAFPFAAMGLVGLVWGDFSIDRAEFLLLGIASAVFYAIYILVSARFLKGVSPLISTPLIQLFAGLTLGSLYLNDWDRSRYLIQNHWLMVLALAVVCSIAAMGLFQAGLQKLKSWEVSILSITEPLTAVLLATVFLSERLGPVQGLSAISLIFALIWVSRPNSRANTNL